METTLLNIYVIYDGRRWTICAEGVTNGRRQKRAAEKWLTKILKYMIFVYENIMKYIALYNESKL